MIAFTDIIFLSVIISVTHGHFEGHMKVMGLKVCHPGAVCGSGEVGLLCEGGGEVVGIFIRVGGVTFPYGMFHLETTHTRLLEFATEFG